MRGSTKEREREKGDVGGMKSEVSVKLFTDCGEVCREQGEGERDGQEERERMGFIQGRARKFFTLVVHVDSERNCGEDEPRKRCGQPGSHQW